MNYNTPAPFLVHNGQRTVIQYMNNRFWLVVLIYESLFLPRLILFCIDIYKYLLYKKKKKKKKIELSYMLGETWLDRVSSINDMGVDMNEKMEHKDVTVGKAFAMLGFIRRLSFEFRDPNTLMSFYTSLICPKLEYVVWVERIFTIFHRMSISVLFCALTRLWKGALSSA
jgi:hypothetical protein